MKCFEACSNDSVPSNIMYTQMKDKNHTNSHEAFTSSNIVSYISIYQMHQIKQKVNLPHSLG